jgi:hypothetical protein
VAILKYQAISEREQGENREFNVKYVAKLKIYDGKRIIRNGIDKRLENFVVEE